MYSRSYNTSNNVPPNYNGTAINPPSNEQVTEDEKPVARVPLMDMPVYSSYAAKKPIEQPLSVIIDEEEITQPVMANPNATTDTITKKFGTDDILLIGLLILLLSCENIDMKLIIAIGVLLFTGL
jgi:hypothetical protein